MKKLRNHMIGIDQGDVVLFSDFEQHGLMWTGEGPRQARAHVRFSEAFCEVPSVRVFLTMWDMSNSANTRADVSTEDILESGFVILFRTWGDSRIARVRVGWQAIGCVKNDDDWDVG